MKSPLRKLRIEAGGQRCHVSITRRENGSVYLTFESQTGYGYPSFELDELEAIIDDAKRMETEK